MSQTGSISYILIVEDHPMMAHAMHGNLLAQRPLAKVARAGSVAAAREIVRKRGTPSLVITDLQLPDSDGIDTLKAVRDMAPDAAVAVFSGHVDASTRYEALALGAVRVLDKTSLADNFVQELAQWLGEAQGAQPPDPASQGGLIAALSQRQQNVLALMAQGHSNRDIASLLSISDFTVKTHVAEILRRLGVQNRTQASQRYLAWAHEHGVGP